MLIAAGITAVWAGCALFALALAKAAGDADDRAGRPRG